MCNDSIENGRKQTLKKKKSINRQGKMSLEVKEQLLNELNSPKKLTFSK